MATSRKKIRNGSRSLAYEAYVGQAQIEFLNPYPWMSSVEARVHLALEDAGAPFTWRYFDGDLAPHLRELMPDFAPEFTLKEYRTVIVILGGFFGTIPGVLDRTALAQALLEMDGWTVVVLYEQDIYGDLTATLEKRLPWFRSPPIKGPPRVPPIGVPDFMEKRRRDLAAWALHRAKYALKRQEQSTRGRNTASGRRRRRPSRFKAGRQGNRDRA